MDLTWLKDAGLGDAPAFALSLAIGLLIGLERERTPSARAGLRTFALVSVLGTLVAMIGQQTASVWVPAAGLLVVGAMMIAAYARNPDREDPGTTTVVALVFAYCLGVIVWLGYARLGATLAITTTVLLYFKPELHGFSERLTRRDLTAILQFGIVSMIILPLLPDVGWGPKEVLNPYRIWWMVVLITGVSLAGYAALRIVGGTRGAALMGALGGLVSTTATTLAFARHARRTPALAGVAVTVIFIANSILFARLAVIAAIVSPGIAVRALPVFGGGLVAALLAVPWIRRRLGKGDIFPDVEVQNPVEFRVALSFALLFAVVLFASAWLSGRIGEGGLFAVAAISGLTDVDAVTLSTLTLLQKGQVDTDAALLAIMLALSANFVAKSVIAVTVAGRDTGWRAVAAMAVSLAGAWVAWGVLDVTS